MLPVGSEDLNFKVFNSPNAKYKTFVTNGHQISPGPQGNLCYQATVGTAIAFHLQVLVVERPALLEHQLIGAEFVVLQSNVYWQSMLL